MSILDEKDIRKLFQNDISLKNIATKEDLLVNEYSILKQKLPKTFFDSEVQYADNSFEVENLIHFLFFTASKGMLMNNLEFTRLPINFNKPQIILDNALIAFDIVKSKYIEYFSGLLGLKSSINTHTRGNCIEYIKADFLFNEHYKNAFNDTYKFLLGCVFVVSELHKTGKLNTRMTEYEKARVLYNWVVLHTDYDLKLKNYSYTGYSALFYGYAVCQGFTALFNMLCKLNGIIITGMAGESKSPMDKQFESHIWSYAILDGKYTYIDVTWGKPIFTNKMELQKSLNVDCENMCDFSYFNIARKDLELEHRWDRNIYG